MGLLVEVQSRTNNSTMNFAMLRVVLPYLNTRMYPEHVLATI